MNHSKTTDHSRPPNRTSFNHQQLCSQVGGRMGGKSISHDPDRSHSIRSGMLCVECDVVHRAIWCFIKVADITLLCRWVGLFLLDHFWLCMWTYIFPRSLFIHFWWWMFIDGMKKVKDYSHRCSRPIFTPAIPLFATLWCPNTQLDIKCLTTVSE